jgi:hypothetical protein
MLNMIRKEVQILGGEMKLCSLSPRLYRYFQEKRLLDIFVTKRTIEQAKLSFRKEQNEDNGGRDPAGDLSPERQGQGKS